MTIATTINRKEYTGNGANDTFAYTFIIYLDGDLKVYVNSVLQTITTHYTVTNAGEPSGGNVVFEAGFIPAADTSVVLWRDVPKTQSTDYVGGERFSAETHETALDRLTVITQQLQDDMDRCIKLAKTVTDAGSVEMNLSATERATKFFGFDVSGELTVSGAVGTWKDEWETAIAYNAGDMVYDGSNGGDTQSVYYCAESHTSGTWATDLAAEKWIIAIDVETVITDAEAAQAAAAASATLAQKWAVDAGLVEATDYSAKQWASNFAGLIAGGSSKEWAATAEDFAVAGGLFSALHYAAKAAADLVLTNADVVSTNADVVSTNADVVTTNADVVLTG